MTGMCFSVTLYCVINDSVSLHPSTGHVWRTCAKDSWWQSGKQNQ